MNYWASLWKIVFKSPNLDLNSKRLQVFFSGPKRPGDHFGSLYWPQHFKWSLRCARVFLKAFFGPSVKPGTLTQSQHAAHMEFQKNMENGYLCLKKAIMAQMAPPYFHNLHILTDSLELAKLNLIHYCQLK